MKAQRGAIEAVEGIAAVYRNMLATVLAFYWNPEKFTDEQKAAISHELQSIDPTWLTLPWESETFDFNGMLEQLLQED